MLDTLHALFLCAAFTAGGGAQEKGESRPAAAPVSSGPAPLCARFRQSVPVSPAELLSEMRAAGAESVRDVTDYALTSVKTDCAREAATRRRIARILLELPRVALRLLSDGNLSADDFDTVQQIGLAVLARMGQDSVAIQTALQLTLPIPAEREVRPGALLHLTDTLGSILGRKPELIAPFGRQIQTSSPLLHAAILAGIGETARCESTRVLTAYLGRWPDFDVMILQQVGRHTGPMPIALLTTEVTAVVRYLAASSEEKRREAALALGRTESASAIPDLLTRLSDESPAVRDAAHWALKSITGVRFRNDPARWAAWYADEEAWWNGRGSGLVKSLGCQPPERLASAARELAGHRGWREQICLELVPLLDSSPSATPRARILEVITSLRSSRAVPLLVERLASAPEPMRAEIASALERITGEPRGASADAWNAWLP
jgi:hypothetical protein